MPYVSVDFSNGKSRKKDEIVIARNDSNEAIYVKVRKDYGNESDKYNIKFFVKTKKLH